MNAALICAAVNLLQDPEEQHSTGCNAEDTPVVAKTTDSTPAAANNNAEYAPALATANSIERTPTVAARTWHYTAMPAAAFALSALLGHIATKAILKRIRSGRN